MKKIILYLLLFFALACASPSSELEHFYAIVSDYETFQAYDKTQYPLGDFSEERFERSAEFWSNLQQKLNKIDTTGFDRTDQISYALLDFELTNHLEDFKFKTHWNPILSDAGFHNNLVYRVSYFKRERGPRLFKCIERHSLFCRSAHRPFAGT